MTGILHSVPVLGTTVLSLSILFFGVYLINFISQRPNTSETSQVLNSRIRATSFFEQAAITCTIAGLYAVLMILFLTLTS
jgi:hypothetical protein